VDEVDWNADATLAVVAHSLLGSMTVIIGSLKTVERLWDTLDDARRTELLAAAREQALHVGGVLGDLARGLPPAAVELLATSSRTGSEPAPSDMATKTDRSQSALPGSHELPV
jgi:hypothetical protein